MSNKDNYNKLLLILVCILCATLIVLFFWGEFSGLSTSKKISHEKFNAFFTSLGAILTATSIFFLYKQTKLLQEERKLAVQPDLFPSSKIIYCSEAVSLGKYYPTFSTRNFEYSSDKGSLIDLHNIGLGTAKKIIIRWDYNIEKVSSIVKAHYEMPLDTYNRPIFNTIDFLKADENITFEIPYGYMALLGNKITPDTFFVTTPSSANCLPQLKLSISYSNSYNEREYKDFILMYEKNKKIITISFHQL